ncbi:MAG: nucleoid-associated protein [Flavobacteriaceae bacterium]|nr:nucleoid-associated protein [Flavobacteriaceae bacterium]
MIKRNKALISKFIIHKVGNKFNEATNVFSENSITFDEESYKTMVPFLLKPFASVVESYRFHHHADINLNEINTYAKQVFADDATFVEVSKNIVNHLYEQSNSAQIKTGDVLIALVEGIEYRDAETNALGIFKIENKVDFFQTYLENNSFEVFLQKGISTKKIDKGCLILNSSDDEGNTVLSVDNNNYDAHYWIQNFLNIKYANDANRHTQVYLELCKDFSEEVIKEQLGSHHQNQFLARTVDFFKENETLNVHDFKDTVFDEDTNKQLFDNYKNEFQEINNLVVFNQFPVAEAVVKKQKRAFKTEIKLDTNIQIKLDIDAPDAAEEYLEKGYDEQKKMKYYKVYFNEED